MLLVPCALATLIGALLLHPFGHEQRSGQELGLSRVPMDADVTAVVEQPCDGGVGDVGDVGGGRQCVTVTVRFTDGEFSGRSVTIAASGDPSAPRWTVGDAVVVAYSGSDPQSGESFEVVDYQRGFPLAVLAVLFAGAVLLLGRWQGLAALGAMVLSFVVLLVFVLPAILAGRDPLLVGLVGAGLIMFVVLYLTHGVSARTSTAVLGTLLSLAIIGVLGTGFSALARLTGVDEDTAGLIGLLGHGIDTRGLLLAGVVIGALGVLDDVTVTQTSAVWELRRANPALGWRELFAAGQRIGRDHVSSVVNTLVMAYTGAALPLLLALSVSGRGLGDVLTAQQVAQEIVRTLVGSIGLVAAVPITTALAAFVATRGPGPGSLPPAGPGAHPDDGDEAPGPDDEPHRLADRRAMPAVPERRGGEGRPPLRPPADPRQAPNHRPATEPWQATDGRTGGEQRQAPEHRPTAEPWQATEGRTGGEQRQAPGYRPGAEPWSAAEHRPGAD
ncbi:MAG TPA: YibE/F family protein, partial [Pseudonocardiaceae bacterium]